MKLQLLKDKIYHCAPAIECLVDNIGEAGSILEDKSCLRKAPYISYTILRVLAELFPVIIHTLLNISIIVATRETSVDRGNVGHQWAFYPIGILFFANFLGLLNHLIVTPGETDVTNRSLITMITFPITMFVAAIVVLFSG